MWRTSEQAGSPGVGGLREARRRPSHAAIDPAQSRSENRVEQATSPIPVATCRRIKRQAGSLPQPARGLFHPIQSYWTRFQARPEPRPTDGARFHGTPEIVVGRLRSAGIVLIALSASMAWAAAEPVVGPLGAPGTQSTYRLEAGAVGRSGVVEQCTLNLGPIEDSRRGPAQWLALCGTKPGGQQFRAWILARSYPPRTLGEAAMTTERYLCQEGDGRVVEFVHRFTGAPVLPSLGAWEYLWPRAELDAPRDAVTAAPDALPLRVAWLGHWYGLEAADAQVPFPFPRDVRRLLLLPDVLIGVPSNSRTQDDQRRFDGTDYPMVRLTRADYAEMIRAGLNCFRVDAEQAAWLEGEPVFYWGVGGQDLAFPECLFRSTYLGPALFLDEPAVGTRDHVIRPRLAREPDFRRQLTPAIVLDAFKVHFHEAVRDGAPAVFLKGIRSRTDVDLGTMAFPQRNLYSWETMIASAAWQLTAESEDGPAAIVFEPPGRLGTRRTLPEMNMAYGCQLPADDPANLAGIIMGFLRGAARAAGKTWGVSIYGAVDQADAPWLLTHAYDLGATHFFFWDNYQLACVPHGEVLSLARHLRAHVEAHPERDLERLRRAAEVAILLPPGYDLGHTHMGRGNLWGLGELNLERTNRFGVRYRQVMENFFSEIERCRRLGVAFDLLWDLAGLTLDGYREVVRVREDGRVEVAVSRDAADDARSDHEPGGARLLPSRVVADETPARQEPRPTGRRFMESGDRVVLEGARVPERPAGRPPQLAVELHVPADGSPGPVTARAQVIEGASPVYYTTGADRSGVYPNVMVLWELYGPAAEDYRTLAGRVVERTSGDVTTAVVEAQFRVEQPGRYRLRAATTDLAGRSAVVWKEFAVP